VRLLQLPPEATSIVVLDLCCGRGGDLHKWKEAVHRRRLRLLYIGVDVSQDSVDECGRRAGEESMQMNVVLTCGDALEAVTTMDESSAHIISMQYAIHYFCNTYERIHALSKHISRVMHPDGAFIGTYMVSDAIKRSDAVTFSTPHERSWATTDAKLRLAPWGAPYTYNYGTMVVNSREFVVWWPALVRAMAMQGLLVSLHAILSEWIQTADDCKCHDFAAFSLVKQATGMV
jgi:ubiquinone/menaquinone biosynthesis C-methylase UbiE